MAGDVPKKAFLGIIMKGDLAIGRVNLYDLGGGAEGISQITVFEDCPWDLDDNGTVGILDLLTLLANWGPCP